MLGARNLVQCKDPGKTVGDLEAFKQKHDYCFRPFHMPIA